MRSITTRKLAGVLALSLGMGLSACGGVATNTSLESVKQPVVERTNYTLDVDSGSGSLPYSEQQRILAWFDSMNLKYGDTVSLDDPLYSGTTRDQLAELAGRRGILISPQAPVTAGTMAPGQARVVITRTTAHVPGCPDWSARSDFAMSNATSPGYGCATNSNLAAMVANPEDLIQGQRGTGETTVTTSTKAIQAYREAPVTGKSGLTENSTGGN